MDYKSLEFNKAIEEQLSTLPKIIKEIILKDEWKPWVGNIVKKNTLNLDQASSLEAEIFTFLIGLTGIFDLRKNIQEELAIPVSKVNDIMIDINDIIVEPLKHKLIDATEGEDEAMSSSVAPIAQTIELKKKEEEILDRQKILEAIEESHHAPGVGVYVPNANKEAVPEHMNMVEPIAQNAQIGPQPSRPQIAPTTVTPTSGAQTVLPDKPTPPPTATPTNIFEAKTAAVITSAHARTTIEPIPVTTPAQEKPATTSSTDPYREPII